MYFRGKAKLPFSGCIMGHRGSRLDHLQRILEEFSWCCCQVPDRHPIPRIQEMLDNLGGNSSFSVLYQRKAYHQGFMSPNSQPATAPWGFYECVRMPFGLSRAIGVFQCFMENCLGDVDTVCVLTWMTLSYSVPPLGNTLKTHVRSFSAERAWTQTEFSEL